MLSEQPADWTTPGAYEVVPGVHRIPLPLVIDGLHAVNVYVLDGAEGPVLIDSGWASPESRTVLGAGLSELGYALADVAEFVVTHAHWDHYTQAISLQRDFGTRVRVGRGEYPSIDAFASHASNLVYPQQVGQLATAGAAELAHAFSQMTISAAEHATPFGAPDAWLDDSDKIEWQAGTLEVLATPGHTRGHIVLREAAAGLLFAGDHILPHITPSIGLERAPEAHPLRSYLSSLRIVRDQPDLLLLPAHGPVTPSVHRRVEELLAHHEQRLAAVLALVRAGNSNAAAVAGALPWTRRERRLSDLDRMNQMMAILEIQAHLDVLADQGLIGLQDSTAPVHDYSVQ
jgi:glyoxylase-like metal-dependent hydrolase (beta-lactamase superfamily II)